MSGICGYADSTAAADAAATMARALVTGPGVRIATVTAGATGVAAAGLGRQGSVYADDAVMLAVFCTQDCGLADARDGAPTIAARVAHAYRDAGAGFLERLTGGFALALIDHRQDSALLAVDRMGACPL